VMGWTEFLGLEQNCTASKWLSSKMQLTVGLFVCASAIEQR
jgi:hypothetical protein